MAEDRQLTALEASTLKLSFNFQLTGFLEVEPISLSGASIDYQAVVYSDGHHETDDGVTLIYGPGPGGDQYLLSGNPNLVGSVNQAFSLLHEFENEGFYSMLLISSADNRALAHFRLTLESVSLVGGVTTATERAAFSTATTTPVSTLGVRIVESGEVMTVGALATVPEPTSLALVVASLSLLAAAQGRTKRGQRPVSA